MPRARAAWLIALLAVGMCCVVPRVVRAHGGSAKITRVAAFDAGGRPWLLVAGDGLVRRGPDGWRFVCPAAFGAATIVDALAATEDSAWVVTTRALHRLDADGTIERAAQRCGDDVQELVAHHGVVHVLARDVAAGRSVVCALTSDAGPRELYSSAQRIEGMASDGEQLWLLRRAERDALELASLSDDGSASEWSALPLPMAAASLRLRAAGAALFVHAIAPGRYTLLRVEAEELVPVLDSPLPLYGPIVAGDALFALRGRQLYTGSSLGLELEPTAWTLPFDRVEGRDGTGFALAAGALYRLPPTLPSGDDALMTLDDVSPPDDADEVCTMQWRRFAPLLHDHSVPPDGGLTADAGASTDASPPAASASCSARPRGVRPFATWTLVLVLLLVACAIARNRRRLRG